MPLLEKVDKAATMKEKERWEREIAKAIELSDMSSSA
jgi:hypothetical protein